MTKTKIGTELETVPGTRARRRQTRAWRMLLVWFCLLIPASADEAERGTEPPEAATVAPETWARFVGAQYTITWSGEAWREPVTVGVRFADAAVQELHEAEVAAGRREALLRHLLERETAKGNREMAFILALCRLSGALGERNFDEALRLADIAGGEQAKRVRQVMLWRVLRMGEEAPRRSGVEELARELAADGYAGAASEIAAVGARMLKSTEREEGRTLIERGIELARENPVVLAQILRDTMRSEDAEALIEVVERIEALESQDEKLKETLLASRLYAALRLGRFDLVDHEELAAEMKRRFGPKLVWATGALAGAGVLLAACLVFWTRRRVDGPGWLLALTWAGLAPVALSVVIFSAAWAALTALLILAALLLSLSPARRAEYFASPRRPRSLPWEVLGVLALTYLINGGFVALLTWLGQAPQAQGVAMLLAGKGGADSAVRFVLFALLVPVIEELAFRGYLLDVARRRMRRGWAIALVSGIFGLIHGWMFALPLAIFGVFAALLRERHGGLWAPIALHVMNNAIGFVCVNYFAR